MVHALQEIRRVLVPDGVLIDLRPLVDRWPVEVSTSNGSQQVGRLRDHEIGLADDKASNKAIAQADAMGWFRREREEMFPFFYYWDTPNEMKQYIEEEWAPDWSMLDDESLLAARSAWALGGAEARVRVQLKLLITRWRKTESG